MASNTNEQDSDDSSYNSRRKTRRQRVSSSSSDSDDSLLARPSRKKCKVSSDTESDSTATSDSEVEEILSRRQQKRPQRNAVASCGETTPENGSAVPNSSVSADLNSSDRDEGDKCIICFTSLKPPFGHPSSCSHHFHPKCLATWSKTSNTCPIDRVKYTAIHVVDHKGDLVSREAVTTPPPQDHSIDADDAIFCEVCSQHDREHEMLLCDICESGYHLDCLTPPLREVPDGNWFCPICTEFENTWDRRRIG